MDDGSSPRAQPPRQSGVARERLGGGMLQGARLSVAAGAAEVSCAISPAHTAELRCLATRRTRQVGCGRTVEKRDHSQVGKEAR